MGSHYADIEAKMIAAKNESLEPVMLPNDVIALLPAQASAGNPLWKTKGYKEGDKFVVLKDYNPNLPHSPHGFSRGQVVEADAYYMDASAPLFRGANKRWQNATTGEGAYVSARYVIPLDKLEDYLPKSPPMVTITTPTTTAPEFLQKAKDLMLERGKTYDEEGGEGERSMGKTVEAFNIITGRDLSESEGWLLLQILKDVRQWSNGSYHADSAEDCVAYSALKAEALLQEGLSDG